MRTLTEAEARRMRVVAQGVNRASREGAHDSAATGAPAATGALAASSGPAAAGRAPAQAVRHMVAMQGQDLPQVLRAIAIRSAPGTTLDDVRGAFNRGEIVRSWPMRGTLFAIVPDDLAVLLAWTAERIRHKSAPQRRDRELDDATVARARELAVAAIADAPRTRAQMLEVWEQAGIATGGGRGYQLIIELALSGLAHWGPFAGAQQQLVPSALPAVPDPEAALTAIARRYIAAHGPATSDDFAWWTGLTKTDARAAIARADGLVAVSVAGEPMWVVDEAIDGVRTGVLLMPGFDELVMGYRDRSLIASPAMMAALVPGKNGVFLPAVLVDGRAVGTWRWPPQRGKQPVEPLLEIVERVTPTTHARIERAVHRWPHR